MKVLSNAKETTQMQQVQDEEDYPLPERCAITNAQLKDIPENRQFWLQEKSNDLVLYDLCALGFKIKESLEENGFVFDSQNKQLTHLQIKEIRARIKATGACERIAFRTQVQGRTRVQTQQALNQAQTRYKARYAYRATSNPSTVKNFDEWYKIQNALLQKAALPERNRLIRQKRIDEFNRRKREVADFASGISKTVYARVRPLIDLFDTVKRKKEREINALRKSVAAHSLGGRKLHVYELTHEPTENQTMSLTLMTYTNILYDDIQQSLPAVLAASQDRWQGKTLIVLSTIVQERGSLSGKVVNAICSYFKDTGKTLDNVTVINSWIDLRHVIPRFTFVREIVNVKPPFWPIKSLHLYRNGEYVMFRGVKRHTKFMIMLGNECDRSAFYPSAPLLEKWWYKLFVSNTPVCAENQLIQTTGTCWWNTAMNILILTDTLASLLRLAWSELTPQYKDRIENILLENCPSPTMLLRDFLFVLMNQVIIKGQRARGSQKNFSEIGAGYTMNALKGIREFHELVAASAPRETLHDFMEKWHGADASSGLEVCMSELFARGPHFNSIEFDTNRKAFNTQIAKEGTITWSHENLEPSVQKQLWSVFPSPLVIIITNAVRMRRCALTITVNSKRYSLESAAVKVAPDDAFASNHVIAGVTCHSPSLVRYVFDSNNFIGTDDWTQLICKLDEKATTTAEEEPTETIIHNEGVLKSYRSAQIGYTKKINRFFDFACLVYILDTKTVP